MTTYDVELKNIIKDFDSGRGKQLRAVDDIDLNIERGEFFALLGPSGCGKTTTLRIIAGFEQPTSGSVRIRGQEMAHIPPFHRPVNTVFQDYALFPHMSVLQNVMFGLQMENVNKKEAQKRAEDALEMVRLPKVSGRKPDKLSGGQQQRVALARALVKRPAVLLLDEPLGALDLKLRKEMQYELKSMQQQVGITFIYVTHDQEEAITMADRIAVMQGGKVLQVGSPYDIYENPATHFVADFIGETNFMDGTLERIADGIGQVRITPDTVIPAQIHPASSPKTGDRVSIAIRPERIGILPADAPETALPPGNNLTVLPATLINSQYIGTDTRHTLQIAENIMPIARMQNMDFGSDREFAAGQAVRVFWSVESTTILTA